MFSLLQIPVLNGSRIQVDLLAGTPAETGGDNHIGNPALFEVGTRIEVTALLIFAELCDDLVAGIGIFAIGFAEPYTGKEPYEADVLVVLVIRVGDVGSAVWV